MSRNSVIIIPALNPDDAFVSYVEGLVAEDFKKIIVIDDGSCAEKKKAFTTLRRMEECDVLVHTVNMGKGRALKNALNYYCQKYAGEYSGVITVDSDGQHTVEDVIKLDHAVKDSSGALVLGCRDFDLPTVPFKSKFGNKITRQTMRILIGKARKEGDSTGSGGITDTQTGLRAIPNPCIPSYLTLKGERFEYETNMLIEALRQNTLIREIPIQTVYINENKETHFRPIADSLAIYQLIFSTFIKYTFASISSFVIDYGIYCLMIFLLQALPLAARVWTATLFARLCSSLYNYFMNMAVVFKNRRNKGKTLTRYYILCAIQFCCSATIVWLLCQTMAFSEIDVKIFVDFFLFLISFQVQKRWVFKEEHDG